MKKWIFGLMLSAIACHAAQNYTGARGIGPIWVSTTGTAYVGFNTSPSSATPFIPSDVCVLSGKNVWLQFDATSALGKQMLATILNAKSAQQGVDIWYDNISTATSGCTVTDIAAVRPLLGIGISR